MLVDKFGLSDAKKTKYCSDLNFDRIVSNSIETQVQKIPLDKLVGADVSKKITDESTRLEKLINSRESAINSSITRKGNEIKNSLPASIQNNIKNNVQTRKVIDDHISQKLVPVQQSLNGLSADFKTAKSGTHKNFENIKIDVKTLKDSYKNISESLKNTYRTSSGTALEQRCNGISADLATLKSGTLKNFENLGKDIEAVKSSIGTLVKEKVHETLKNLDAKTIQIITKQLEYNIGTKLTETLSNLGDKDLNVIASQLDSSLIDRINVLDGRLTVLGNKIEELILNN